MRTLVMAATTVAVLLAGCAGDEEVPVIDDPSDAPSDASGDEAPSDEVPSDTGDPAAGSDPLLGPEVEQAIAELEADGVDRAAIEVTTTELVTWPDGALGCPEPDQMYTQALVEGYRIVLTVDGEDVAFHGAAGGPPQRCDDPQPPVDA